MTKRFNGCVPGWHAEAQGAQQISQETRTKEGRGLDRSEGTLTTQFQTCPALVWHKGLCFLSLCLGRCAPVNPDFGSYSDPAEPGGTSGRVMGRAEKAVTKTAGEDPRRVAQCPGVSDSPGGLRFPIQAVALPPWSHWEEDLVGVT